MRKWLIIKEINDLYEFLRDLDLVAICAKTGHIAFFRPSFFSFFPSPIQSNYWGLIRPELSAIVLANAAALEKFVAQPSPAAGSSAVPVRETEPDGETPPQPARRFCKKQGMQQPDRDFTRRKVPTVSRASPFNNSRGGSKQARTPAPHFPLATNPYFKEQAPERLTYSTLHTIGWECNHKNSTYCASGRFFCQKKTVERKFNGTTHCGANRSKQRQRRMNV